MADLPQPEHAHHGEHQDEIPPMHSRPPTRNEFVINIPDLLIDPGQCAVRSATVPSHHYEHYVQNPIVDTTIPTHDEFVIDIDNFPTYPEACAVRKPGYLPHHCEHEEEPPAINNLSQTSEEFVINIDSLPTYPAACAVREPTQPVIDTDLEGGASTDTPESPDSTTEPRNRKPRTSIRARLHRLWSPTWRWLALLLVLGTLTAVIVGICAFNLKQW